MQTKVYRYTLVQCVPNNYNDNCSELLKSTNYRSVQFSTLVVLFLWVNETLSPPGFLSSIFGLLAKDSSDIVYLVLSAVKHKVNVYVL